MKYHLLLVALLLQPAGALAGDAASTQSATAPADVFAQQCREVAKTLREGQLDGGVYTVSYPRTDLTVNHEMGEVPAAAGLISRFYFFPCPCGRLNLVGEFVVCDYESSDVIDELRSAHIKIASIAPILQGERPRLLSIRFEGEGSAAELAAGLRKALSWTGDERMKSAPVAP